jgi:hypothetical protein
MDDGCFLVGQRVSVAVSCLCFVVLLATEDPAITLVLFVAVGLLACVEKLAATANTVAVERDWVRWYCTSFLDLTKVINLGDCDF